MKITLIAILLAFSTMNSFTLSKKKPHDLQVMTFNIRYDNEQDGINKWVNRKEKVAGMLQFYDVDICGMQEALLGQVNGLRRLLPNYSHVGVGRDDGKEAGEYSPIFYRMDKYKLLESNTFWLSLTPDQPSKSWDAALPRIVTYAKFKSIREKREFYVFNTHFDHLGQEARRESAQLLLKKVKEIAQETPAIIMGDFNSTPKEEPIKLLMHRLIDTERASKTPHFGPISTFNEFKEKEIDGKLIDYIFVNSETVTVQKHATLSPTWEGRFASDHHAVFAKLTIE